MRSRQTASSAAGTSGFHVRAGFSPGILDEDADAICGGAPVPDADLTLRSYATLASLVATYTELTKGAQVEEQGGKVIFSGNYTGGRYKVTLREQGKEDGVFINIASWRGKEAQNDDRRRHRAANTAVTMAKPSHAAQKTSAAYGVRSQ